MVGGPAWTHSTIRYHLANPANEPGAGSSGDWDRPIEQSIVLSLLSL